MAVLGTFDSPLIVLLEMVVLVVTSAWWAWFFGRSAMRRRIRRLDERIAELTEQLTACDAENRQGLELVEQLQANLRTAQEEAARRAPAETRDTTPFPAGNGVASPVSESMVLPDVMRRAPLDEWVKTIDKGVRSGNPDAGLLAAQLHVVAACETGEAEPRALLGALKEVSRYLACLLSSSNQAPLRIAEDLTVWAEQFNSVARGRYSIQVPRLGGSVDLSYTSPRAGAKIVSQVLTWAVRNASGIAEFKAEVA